VVGFYGRVSHVKFESTSMLDFLTSQSNSLEYLKLMAHGKDSEFAYEFPRMNRLKVFCIEYSEYNRRHPPDTDRRRKCGQFYSDWDNDSSEEEEDAERYNGRRRAALRFKRLNWTESFPNLEEFQMDYEHENHWLEALFNPQSPPHETLKVIQFPSKFNEFNRTTRETIGEMFPNISTIKLPFSGSSLPLFNGLFPNLKKLVFLRGSGHYKNYIRLCDEADKIEGTKQELRDLAWGVKCDWALEWSYKGDY